MAFELNEYSQYEHHGKEVTVKTTNMGKHRENCLCHECGGWNNCTMRKKLYELCCKFNLVTPVWECPSFIIKGDK